MTKKELKALEHQRREEGWVMSADLLRLPDAMLLARAIRKLDAASMTELRHDFESDDYRFFNVVTGEFRAGKTWVDI